MSPTTPPTTPRNYQTQSPVKNVLASELEPTPDPVSLGDGDCQFVLEP